MDLAGGLSAASTALTIVKQLKEIDKSVDEASFKLAIAELTEALAETKIALSEAKMLISDQAFEIKKLEANLQATTSEDKCPLCKNGSMQVLKTEPKGTGLAARSGVQIWTTKCDAPECGHEDKKLHDPNGLLKNR